MKLSGFVENLILSISIKKRVLNSLCFGGDRLEILRILKTQKMSFSAIFEFLLIRHI
jgi:hypothetical protein